MPNQTHETNRSHNINLRVLSWMAIFAFVSVSAWYGFSMYRLAKLFVTALVSVACVGMQAAETKVTSGASAGWAEIEITPPLG
ncbi:MAG: hypothetical protein ABIP71_00045, partial [Verrucomicrobiota bacterium]